MSDYKHPNQSISREHQIVLELTEYLISENYNVRFEVPNLGQSADLVATRG